MSAEDDLFATGPSPSMKLELIEGRIPLLMVDDIFRDPVRVREVALSLDYGSGTANYPGRVARFPDRDPSLMAFLLKVVRLVNDEYLPRLPPLPDGRRATKVVSADTDFAITDRHPDELSPLQRRPHVDAVPVFGLVYLNEIDRGGTLFFKPKTMRPGVPRHRGYQVESDEDVVVAARIEGRFNRLAVYPGFIPHSGEVKGDWILGDERFNSPRLTQRIPFFL